MDDTNFKTKLSTSQSNQLIFSKYGFYLTLEKKPEFLTHSQIFGLEPPPVCL